MDYSTILSPDFIVENIDLIGQIIAVMLLVVFDEFFTQKLAFNSSDRLKALIIEKSKERFKKKYRGIIKYLFEIVATCLFIIYFFLGYWFLSEYAIEPIIENLQSVISKVLIVIFLIMSKMLNDRKVRRKYLGYR